MLRLLPFSGESSGDSSPSAPSELPVEVAEKMNGTILPPPPSPGLSNPTLGYGPLPLSLTDLVCLILRSRDLFLKLVFPRSGLAWALNLFQE